MVLIISNPIFTMSWEYLTQHALQLLAVVFLSHVIPVNVLMIAQKRQSKPSPSCAPPSRVANVKTEDMITCPPSSWSKSESGTNHLSTLCAARAWGATFWGSQLWRIPLTSANHGGLPLGEPHSRAMTCKRIDRNLHRGQFGYAAVSLPRAIHLGSACASQHQPNPVKFAQ